MFIGLLNSDSTRKTSSYIKLPNNLSTRKLFNEISHLKNSLSKPNFPHSRYRSTGSGLTDLLVFPNSKSPLQSKQVHLPPLDQSSSPKPNRESSSIGNPEDIINCVTRCSYKTKTGSVNGNLKPENQDSFIIKANIMGVKGIYLFAVCDGHGPEGHSVARFIKQHLGDLVESSLYSNPPEQALESALSQLSDKLLDSSIDTSYSGSTIVCVLVYGDQIICANIGDSRAIMSSKKKTWSCISLSQDHKPENKTEATRIIEAGGRIKAMYGKNLRIWLPDKDIPGLSMTRSLGDQVCRTIGLISTPEIYTRRLLTFDQILILASDGVWEFISNQEAVGIVGELRRTGKSENCCEMIVKEATKRWKEQNNSIDDITVIVVFLYVK